MQVHSQLACQKHATGLLSEGQIVYLKDNDLEITHNLNESATRSIQKQAFFKRKLKSFSESDETMGNGRTYFKLSSGVYAGQQHRCREVAEEDLKMMVNMSKRHRQLDADACIGRNRHWNLHVTKLATQKAVALKYQIFLISNQTSDFTSEVSDFL
ncbi:hypothetical protein FQA39_LY19410 [Lamprigera yunnana]|nr:hypothetical protein FQA39_LY19410 [Lamprigera yunnana]